MPSHTATSGKVPSGVLTPALAPLNPSTGRLEELVYPFERSELEAFDLEADAASSTPEDPPPAELLSRPPSEFELERADHDAGIYAPGLSNPQFSPRLLERDATPHGAEDSHDAPVVLYEDGSLLEVKLPSSARGCEPPSGHSTTITEFSPSSRRRMLRQFARMRRDESARGWYFVTLTFPGRWVGTYTTAKKCIDRFAKRLNRRFPQAAYVWKMDIKARRSGLSAGENVPHFHLAIYCPGIEEEALLRWIGGEKGEPDRGVWQEITLSSEMYEHVGLTEQEELDHCKAAHDCEEIESFNGVMFYAAEYMAHELELEAEDAPGRFWGIRWRKNVPWSGTRSIYLSRERAQWLLRVIQRSCGYEHRPERAFYLTSGENWASKWWHYLGSNDPPPPPLRAERVNIYAVRADLRRFRTGRRATYPLEITISGDDTPECSEPLE